MLDTAFKSINQVAKEMETMADQAVKENEHVIIDMNTENLMKGKDANDEKITPQYYSDEYAEMKQGMNPRPGLGTPDLFLTGVFQEGFFVKRVKMGWEIDSKDEKRDKLVTKYTDIIFGNTDKDEKEINEEYILPELIDHALDNLEL